MVKRFHLLLFSCILFTGQSNCQEKKQSVNRIPIIAWHSIPPEQTSVLRYQELKEAGITCNLSFFNDAETMANALDTANEAGIKMIVSCPELKTATEKTVRRFMTHPAVAGYMLRDEPGRSDFPELGEWVKKIRKTDNSHFCYLNLFPNYASEQQLGTKTYQEHVDLFVQHLQDMVLEAAGGAEVIDLDLLFLADAVQPADAWTGDATILNFRTGFDWDNYSIRFWVKNLTDEDSAVVGTFTPNATRRYDWVRGAIGQAPLTGLEIFGGVVTARPPRSLGVTVSMKF